MKRLIKIFFGWLYPQFREELGLIINPNKSKIDKWREYAENLVIKSGIDLENVLVHNLGNWGQCGNRALFYNNRKELCFTYSDESLGKLMIPLPIPNSPYIIVPEITCWWTFRAWIHEVGHYVNGHYKDLNKSRLMKEFEAETYCMKMCQESGICDDYDMIDIKYSAVGYLDRHVDLAIVKGDIKYKEDIPQEVYYFLYQCNYMKEEIEKKALPSKPIPGFEVLARHKSNEQDAITEKIESLLNYERK